MEIPKNFSEIINQALTKFSAMDARNRYLVFSGILLAIFAVDYFILMQPQLNALNRLNPKIKGLSDDLKTTRENIKKIDYYRAQVGQFKEKVANVSLRVRSKDEVSIILEEISQMANRNHLKIDQIVPDLDGLKQLIENDNKVYYALPISINSKSGYHNLGRFLNQIETSDVFFTLATLSMSPSEDPTMHVVKLTVNAIVYDFAKTDKKKEKKAEKKK